MQKQEPKLRAAAKDIWHLMTHRCKNSFCPTCMKVKMQRWPCRSHLPPAPDKFGAEVCADTLLAYTNESWGLEGEAYAVVMYDRATKYIGGFPEGNKSADDHKEALREFL